MPVSWAEIILTVRYNKVVPGPLTYFTNSTHFSKSNTNDLLQAHLFQEGKEPSFDPAQYRVNFQMCSSDYALTTTIMSILSLQMRIRNSE